MPSLKTDRPIIFSAPMVLALLDGRKTMTRRVIKPQPCPFEIDDGGTLCEIAIEHIEGDARPRIRVGRVITRQETRYAPGDQLWVRETSAIHPKLGFGYIHGPNAVPIEELKDAGAKIIPSIFMKRKDSRLTLTVTGVKVERVQDISEADAQAEGCPDSVVGRVAWFRALWDSINADRMDGAASWGCNPWVYDISFKFFKCNIDAMSRETATI